MELWSESQFEEVPLGSSRVQEKTQTQWVDWRYQRANENINSTLIKIHIDLTEALASGCVSWTVSRMMVLLMQLVEKFDQLARIRYVYQNHPEESIKELWNNLDMDSTWRLFDSDISVRFQKEHKRNKSTEGINKRTMK